MKKIFLIPVLILSGFAVMAQQSAGRLEKLDAYVYQTKLVHMLHSLVDVRTPDEFASGTIPGAMNIEWESEGFKEAAAKLPQYKPVFLFCQGGYRSAQAAEWFLKKGYSTVIILDGGYDAWKAYGFPTTEQQEANPNQSPGSYDPD
ncbi:MAG: rhodanese-like domain-containing protein [Bacteroidetes bacterium]|nr:rhodanese-like domain-containing protein [Bacteroidota bacterium]